MKITKDTIACISIAERPGNFGAAIFNAAFEKLGMDYVYKPFKVAPGGAQAVLEAVRATGIRGCGVSMPHKSAVLPFLDSIDPLASRIGAVNTIVNEDGKLIGYNTDVLGAGRALSEVFGMAGKTALVIGAGGAARAIIVALQEAGAKEVILLSRDNGKAKQLADEFGISFREASQKTEIKADLLANATPVGMAPNAGEMIIDERALGNFSAVLDVVVSPMNTKLIEMGRKMGKLTIPGYRMSLYQAAAQFKLYTKIDPPMEFMEKEVQRILA